MIEISGVNKSFTGHLVLRDINLSIHEGEIFGIIGKSGAGKSTLLRCMNLLERPDSGRIKINNEALTELSTGQLNNARHHIAMIFQHFNLLHTKTVYENIALPMRIQGTDEATIEQKIDELLPLVELEDKKHAWPSQLSGGQKQRVAIARALSTSPKVLLCDEATSALDPATTDAILSLLQKINALYGITIVLITHEMDVIKRICTRLAVMESGRIIESLSIAHAMQNKNSLARRMLTAQLSPELPLSVRRNLSEIPNHTPLLRLFFEGNEATVPFISQASRALDLDINILLANIDRFDDITCGVLIVELKAEPPLLQAFIQRCEQSDLTVEILGYVTDSAL